MVLFAVVALMMAMLDSRVPQRSLARSVKIPPLFAGVAVKAKAASPGSTVRATFTAALLFATAGLLLRLE
jgi:hypothetical protein